MQALKLTSRLKEFEERLIEVNFSSLAFLGKPIRFIDDEIAELIHLIEWADIQKEERPVFNWYNYDGEWRCDMTLTNYPMFDIVLRVVPATCGEVRGYIDFARSAMGVTVCYPHRYDQDIMKYVQHAVEMTAIRMFRGLTPCQTSATPN